MIHDIARCCNKHCEDKYTCKKYLAYVELMKIKYQYPVSMILKTCDTKCENYLEVKNF